MAWKRYLCTKRMEAYNSYKNKRKFVKEAVLLAKKETWERFGNILTESFHENQMLFYGIMKQLINNKDVGMLNIKDKEDNVIIEEELILERRRQHFRELMENERAMSCNSEEARTNLQREEPFAEKEYMEAPWKLKLGKAPGRDNVPGEMIKYMGDE